MGDIYSRHLWWRFWWADESMVRCHGLHFWLGQRPGAGRMVRIWGVDLVLQLLIVALTVPGLWFAGSTDGSARWGFLVLFCSQPLWLAATWRKSQYGMFAIALIYTAIWARSVLNHF